MALLGNRGTKRREVTVGLGERTSPEVEECPGWSPKCWISGTHSVSQPCSLQTATQNLGSQ